MKIRIKNLSLQTIIGVHDWEREQPQEVVLNAAIEFDGEKASASDQLADTVDYFELTEAIRAEVEQSRYKLVESLAQRILVLIMDNPMVLAAQLELDKPAAIKQADSVSVCCESKRVDSVAS